jgi:hypothetical protein
VVKVTKETSIGEVLERVKVQHTCFPFLFGLDAVMLASLLRVDALT